MKLLLLALFIPAFMNAQIFLQGEYLEVGVHTYGSFGSDSGAVVPAGFHPTSMQLGFVMDYGMDGWDVGEPFYMGDFFVPGFPEEGWGIEFDTDTGSVNFNNFGLANTLYPGYGDNPVPMTSIIDDSSGDTLSCTWNGVVILGETKLNIVQRVYFRTHDLYFNVDISLTNTGMDTIFGLEYFRNIDPDNEIDWTGDYTTSNYVMYQPGFDGNEDKAMVCARGLIYDIPCYLAAIDSNARVSVEGFSNRDPDDILDSPIMPSQTEPSIMDEAIALAFECGNLNPGGSYNMSYKYAMDDEAVLGGQNGISSNNLSGLNVYPNPMDENSTINFILKENSTVKIEIYNTYGQLVSEVTDQNYPSGRYEIPLNTNELPKGMYTVRIENNGKITSRRLIKL
ncbi:MAG: hypothetical protein A2W91_06445 [Bacteroidetes bacterium GWF2_38_335]|nr:MAG: hypothetical protein A2W91_06445 [Bacteroidetes bacterium GWF2_38_335]OFY77672.1 MAG: hypothetical protein A2281_17960 [Bacteroidetes bacterium RIFOXYA12_FULL_38_20]HBS89099.1 hypothetical protein [Bacteroidales bacterium]